MSDEQLAIQLSLLNRPDRDNSPKGALHRLVSCGVLNADGSVADAYKGVFVVRQ